VLSFASGRLWAVEIKRSLSPRPDKGFHLACADLNPARRFVVYPGDESYPVAHDIQVVSLAWLAHMLQRTLREGHFPTPARLPLT
jgi:hypothetical protein